MLVPVATEIGGPEAQSHLVRAMHENSSESKSRASKNGKQVSQGARQPGQLSPALLHLENIRPIDYKPLEVHRSELSPADLT